MSEVFPSAAATPLARLLAGQGPPDAGIAAGEAVAGGLTALLAAAVNAQRPCPAASAGAHPPLVALLHHLAPHRAPEAEPQAPPPDLDAIRAAARAFGHDAGYAAGCADGEARAQAALAPLRADLAAAAAALTRACVIDADALRPLLADLVAALLATVLGAERQRPAALLPLVTAALAAIDTGTAATLVAHPDTLAGLAPHLGDLATGADPALAPGCLRVEGPDFIVPVDLDRRLARMLAALP